MRVWIEKTPRFDSFDVAIAFQAGRETTYAEAIKDGEIVWTTVDAGQQVPVFFRASKDVLDSLAQALGDVTQASDQTLAALADARQTRDRLLSLVEKLWEVPR